MHVVPPSLFKQLWPEEQYFERPLSISVVIIAPRYNKDKETVEGLLIKEKNSRYPLNPPVIKFPSGSMNKEDRDIYATVVREFRTETGHEARKIELCFGAVWNSTEG